MACGSIVLAWLYNGSGGSILACAIGYGAYNLTTATAAGDGTIAAVTSTLVIAQAMVLVALELSARGRGGSSVLWPRTAGDPGTSGPTASSA